MLVIIFSKVASDETSSIEVRIYGIPESKILRDMIEYLTNIRVNVTICYLNSSSSSNEFYSLINLLISLGLQVLPPNFCPTCEYGGRIDWRKIYEVYASPLLIFLQDEKLKAIIVSANDEVFSTNYEGVFYKIFNWSGDDALFFTHSAQPFKIDNNARIKIEGFLKGEGKTNPGGIVNVFQVLPLIIAAAFADSINPCEFFVLVVFLSLVAMRFGKVAILKYGLTYALAIFTIYFLMGLGIWRLIGFIQEAKLFVVILGFSLGLRSILNFIFGLFGISIGLRETIGSFLNRHFKRIPKSFSENISKQLRRFSEKPASSFLVGVVTSAFLLPCTSGPYLLAVSLMSGLEPLQGLLLLILYNTIFVIPFIVITVGVYTVRIKLRELKRWQSTKQRWLNLIGGLLLIALSIYLMFYAIK
ncbi:MAG: hypothetical protein QXH24_04850 [Candidatus Bathyarchaeia archaeon]